MHRNVAAAALGAMLLVALFAALGHWQWRRAAEQEALHAQFAAGTQAQALTALPAALGAPLRYRAIALDGRYVPEVQVLLDNMTRDGAAGYEVLTPFLPAGGAPAVLVNRGWLPASPYRDELPEIQVGAAERSMRGRIDALPRSALRLAARGGAPAAGAVRVMSFPRHEDLEHALGRALVPYQVLLAPGDADGYLRDWRAPGFGGTRNLVYAGQWWALAAATALAAGILALRRRRSLLKPSPRRAISLVALVCLGPVALAAVAYFGPIDIGRLAPVLENPDRELLDAPAPLPHHALRAPGGRRTPPDWARYRWSLIYAKIAPCHGGCAEHLARLMRIHVALGRDGRRAQRVFLTADEDFRMTGDPGLLVGYIEYDRDAELVRVLGPAHLERGSFFVVDPLGNLVMRYPVEADQARLLRDLERLLDASRIG